MNCIHTHKIACIKIISFFLLAFDLILSYESCTAYITCDTKEQYSITKRVFRIECAAV